ncbi:G-protein coupled receptor-like protein [Leptotrombidium deliense]|uniref:G-protein coupled receptor-like protein n=1 Tax=Leptotrombidium deliense TaxID=299467 RepID=A0A443SGC7_9ACAR|nr:G-protein coupled receptor-like protein [Leptotrombidium deliense]
MHSSRVQNASVADFGGIGQLMEMLANFSSLSPTTMLSSADNMRPTFLNTNVTLIQLTGCVSGINCSGALNYSKALSGVDNANEREAAFDNYTKITFTEETTDKLFSLNASLQLTNNSENANRTTIVIEPDLKIHYPILACFLAFICFLVIFGNVLIMIAIKRERYLHTVTNYFIASLAAADCLVGLVVMPTSVVHEVMNKWWVFGQDWCDLWHSFDVLASTASILNLCVISLDRYWAITDPITYPAKMTPNKAAVLIFVVWTCSSLISFPAIIWWRATSSQPPHAYQCEWTDDIRYLVFSSIISFYGPLIVMLFVYYRIYRAAVEQTKSIKLGTKQIPSSDGGEGAVTLRIHRGGAVANQRMHKFSSDSDEHSDFIDENGVDGLKEISVRNRNLKTFSMGRKFAKLAKERKAAKTLGIVMGVFILCWTPFFITHIIVGICHQSCLGDPELVHSVVTWLGWLNSGMNPVIYACWSKDFRRAFKKILCCCCHDDTSRRSRAMQQARYSYCTDKIPKRDKCFDSMAMVHLKKQTSDPGVVSERQIYTLRDSE